MADREDLKSLIDDIIGTRYDVKLYEQLYNFAMDAGVDTTYRFDLLRNRRDDLIELKQELIKKVHSI